MLRRHAVDPVMERQLYSLELGSAGPVPSLELPSKNFACLFVCDARGLSTEGVVSLVEPLLRAGASYFVCWGPDCERVHDIVDELTSKPQNAFGIPAGSCVMTTWHSSESLQEALWFFLAASLPDEHYLDSTRAGLAVSVGSASWAAEIAQALDRPQEFVGAASENE